MSPPEQRVCFEARDRRADRIRRRDCRVGVFFAQELEHPL